MPCYRIFIPASGDAPACEGFICGKLGPHCVDCGTVSDILCDYPVGNGKTCDRKVCTHCAVSIAPDIDYCKYHAQLWLDFKNSGGVKKELENVVPYKTRGD